MQQKKICTIDCNKDDLNTICGWYYPKQKVIYMTTPNVPLDCSIEKKKHRSLILLKLDE